MSTPQIVKTIQNLINEVRALEAERPRVVIPFVTEVYKEIMVEASHLLPNHKAKCQFLHGHSYRVGVTLRSRLWRGKGDETEGMVIDFKEIKEALKVLVDERLDHAYLNNEIFVSSRSILPIMDKHYLRTTAEQLAWWVFIQMYQAFEYTMSDYEMQELKRNQIEVVSVDVWETTTSRATAKREHFDADVLYNLLNRLDRVNVPVKAKTELCDDCEEDEPTGMEVEEEDSHE